MTQYQPKTGQRCGCRRGVQRDNCPECEGTGWRIDFAAIRRRTDPFANIVCGDCGRLGKDHTAETCETVRVWGAK